MRRFFAILLLAAAAVSLCGCGSIFDKEYVAESDYVFPQSADNADEERISVRNLAQLRQVLLDLVSDGKTESSILFDTSYEGDVTEDMASACWQVRSQDALCAYCVKNIAYELSKIVSFYEARITVSYSDAVPSAEEIVKLPYSAGLTELVEESLEQGNEQLVVLVGRSIYAAEDVEQIVIDSYEQCPALAPQQPTVSVKMLSGTGMQRLYELNVNYGMDRDTLEERRKELAALEPFPEESLELDDAHKALLAMEYLTEHCAWDGESRGDSVYAALIEGRANDKGMAFAYTELCRRLGLDTRIVHGQRDWQDYRWNLVKLDGSWYHADPSACLLEGMEAGFLLRDESIWATHRWDTGAYPACTGELSYDALRGGEAAEAADGENAVQAVLQLEDDGAEAAESAAEPETAQTENKA